MKIKEKIGTLNKNCEICIQGKFSQSRNRQPDRRAASTFELIHTDLAGPIEPADINGHRYAITFTDDFSGAIFVYFLKTKKDTVSAAKKFIADTAPHRRIKSLRSDNRSEFKSNDFQRLLCDNNIRHETSVRYSPHQNSEDDSDHTLVNFDYCYKATCNIPRTYREAIDSSDAHCWVEVMHEELESLKENNVFELTNLSEGKKTVGSKWLYTTKENPDGMKRYKARFIA